MSGLKYDKSKPRMDLLSTEALTQIAYAMTAGAEKYGDHNWRGGLAWSRTIAAAMRHLTAFNAGENVDPETGLSHIAHLGCNVMFLLDYIKSHPELDDRYLVQVNRHIPEIEYLDTDRKSGAV